jgi:stage III sporulation protein AG
MFKEKLESIKSMIVSKDGKDNKKKIENLVVFLIILIITIIAINTIWKDDRKKENQNNNDTGYKMLASDNIIQTNMNRAEYEYNLEENLENILQKINGVGKVSVLITYSESSQIVAMYNENSKESSTEEIDKNGGTRKINQSDSSKDIIYKEENGEKVPVTQKLVMPKIEGAVVIAQGAESSEIKASIIQAVEAATGLPTHKIQVFRMKDDI